MASISHSKEKEKELEPTAEVLKLFQNVQMELITALWNYVYQQEKSKLLALKISKMTTEPSVSSHVEENIEESQTEPSVPSHAVEVEPREYNPDAPVYQVHLNQNSVFRDDDPSFLYELQNIRDNWDVGRIYHYKWSSLETNLKYLESEREYPLTDEEHPEGALIKTILTNRTGIKFTSKANILSTLVTEYLKKKKKYDEEGKSGIERTQSEPAKLANWKEHLEKELKEFKLGETSPEIQELVSRLKSIIANLTLPNQYRNYSIVTIIYYFLYVLTKFHQEKELPDKLTLELLKKFIYTAKKDRQQRKETRDLVKEINRDARLQQLNPVCAICLRYEAGIPKLEDMTQNIRVNVFPSQSVIKSIVPSGFKVFDETDGFKMMKIFFYHYYQLHQGVEGIVFTENYESEFPELSAETQSEPAPTVKSDKPNVFNFSTNLVAGNESIKEYFGLYKLKKEEQDARYEELQGLYKNILYCLGQVLPTLDAVVRIYDLNIYHELGSEKSTALDHIGLFFSVHRLSLILNIYIGYLQGKTLDKTGKTVKRNLENLLHTCNTFLGEILVLKQATYAQAASDVTAEEIGGFKTKYEKDPKVNLLPDDLDLKLQKKIYESYPKIKVLNQMEKIFKKAVIEEKPPEFSSIEPTQFSSLINEELFKTVKHLERDDYLLDNIMEHYHSLYTLNTFIANKELGNLNTELYHWIYDTILKIMKPDETNQAVLKARDFLFKLTSRFIYPNPDNGTAKSLVDHLNTDCPIYSLCPICLKKDFFVKAFEKTDDDPRSIIRFATNGAKFKEENPVPYHDLKMCPHIPNKSERLEIAIKKEKEALSNKAKERKRVYTRKKRKEKRAAQSARKAEEATRQVEHEGGKRTIKKNRFKKKTQNKLNRTKRKPYKKSKKTKRLTKKSKK